MYLTHFGLDEYPFSLAPNTRYFLKLSAYEAAFQFIIDSIENANEYTMVTGVGGSGKTLLCKKVISAFSHNESRFTTAFISNPVLGIDDLLRVIATGIGANPDNTLSYAELLKLISSTILDINQNHKKLLLFIDEAQALPDESVDILNLLTSIKTGERGLQTVLFSQTHKVESADDLGIKKLVQKLDTSFILAPLESPEVTQYIRHRLQKAGYNGNSLFTDQALESVFKECDGIPRQINTYCHRALMIAYNLDEHCITNKHIEQASRELQINEVRDIEHPSNN